MAEDRTQTEQKQRPAGLKTEKKQTGQNLREIRVGFVGNPNCGKTTLFNAFTGANLKVANWPGLRWNVWRGIPAIKAVPSR